MSKSLTLDEWCKADGRTMDELAEFFGVSRVHLWRIRKGKAPALSVSVARAIERKTKGQVPAISVLGLDRRKREGAGV